MSIMIVWHRGEKHEIEGHTVKALEALGIAYERIDRRDGLVLYVLDLAFKSVNGWKITSRGRHALKNNGIAPDAEIEEGKTNGSNGS